MNEASKEWTNHELENIAIIPPITWQFLQWTFPLLYGYNKFPEVQKLQISK
jgi:hypothetical protein